MNKKIWRVLLLSLVTGLIHTVVTHFAVQAMVRGTSEWTPEMGNRLFVLTFSLAILLILISGILGLRGFTRREAAKSAALMSGYYLICFLLEQASQQLGLFGVMSFVDLFLFIPLAVYTEIFSLLMRLTGLSAYLLVCPCLLLPFLYALFARPGKAVPQNAAEMPAGLCYHEKDKGE